MALIKENKFISVTGVAPSYTMQTPTRSISNGDDASQNTKPLSEQEIREQELFTEREREQQRRFKEQQAEIDRLKAECARECHDMRYHAEVEANQITSDSVESAERLTRETEELCVQRREQAQKEGYEAGYAAGNKPGYDDGFAEGKAECKTTLDELNKLLEAIPLEKERIFKEHEQNLFDLIFAIANKITVKSLGQKDKSVISKMLREAAKDFRGSSFVKVSLSKLDIEESVNVDLDELTAMFRENQHIEFEILKDSPKGTLILDNGSEITDAGIQTQLKMIENLGKGKFKHKEPEILETETN